MIGARDRGEGHVVHSPSQLLKQGRQALKGHHGLRFCSPYYDQQGTLDLRDMPQNVVGLLWSILLHKNLGSHQQGDGIEGVDEGIRLTAVHMLLRLGSHALELLCAIESGVRRILIIPLCSMSPKFLKLLKRGHENASRGSLANPPLASICA